MLNSRLDVSTLLGSAVLLVTAALMFVVINTAAVESGTLKKVSDDGEQITVAQSEGRRSLMFQLPSGVQVSVNGKPATVDNLTAGFPISVFHESSGRVFRVASQIDLTERRTTKVTEALKVTEATNVIDRNQFLLGRNHRHHDRHEPPSTQASAQLVSKSTRTGTDWAQFRGPNRENVSLETGLLKEWPSGGPKLAWQRNGFGEAYSTVSLTGGKLFTMGNIGDEEKILAADSRSGSEIWSTAIGPAFNQGRGNGPRGTPTIDGDRVYALGGSGNLACCDVETGKILWRKNILKEFVGRGIGWGISESVLIDGDRLICTPGGDQGTIVALDKKNGEAIWQSRIPGKPSASYASPIAINVDGVRQYVVFTSQKVVGVRADDGTLLWENSSTSNGTANCSTPLFHENHVFSATGYGTGGALLKLTSTGNTTSARQVYTTKEMKNQHGGMVIVDGYLYGSNDPGVLTCLELKTGKVMWRDRSVGKGSVTFADGHIYLRSERGPVALVKATPEEYREKGRFDQPNRSDKPSWAHPVVAGGRLYLRDMDTLLCYELR